MAEEPVPVMGRTPVRCGNLTHPECLGLSDQHITNVGMVRFSVAQGESQARHDVRTYFIATATNSNATVHYDL